MFESYKNKKVLVTGSTGYLGSLIVAKLVDTGAKVIQLTSKINKKNESSDIYYVNYQASEDLYETVGDIDYIFHLASQTSAYVAEADVAIDIESNLIPIVNLMKFVSKMKIKPAFIFASSATVYGLQDLKVFTEENKCYPDSIYDLHKKIGEDYVKFFSRRGVIKGCSLRLSNVYGPGLNEGANDRGIVNKFIKMALAGEDISLFGGGQFTRDYVYNEDVVDAFLIAGLKAATSNGDVYNICSGESWSVLKAVELIIAKAKNENGKESKIISKDFPEGSLAIEKRCYVGSWEKFNKVTGWEPSYLLEKGIDEMIGRYL